MDNFVIYDRDFRKYLWNTYEIIIYNHKYQNVNSEEKKHL